MHSLRRLECAGDGAVQEDARQLKVQSKLTKKQYEDEVSWSTRTWTALMAQRLSVALHLAAAWEIAVELKGVGAEEDEAALFGAAASGA